MKVWAVIEDNTELEWDGGDYFTVYSTSQKAIDAVDRLIAKERKDGKVTRILDRVYEHEIDYGPGYGRTRLWIEPLVVDSATSKTAKKVFVSQLMRGATRESILVERVTAIDELQAVMPQYELEIIDSILDVPSDKSQNAPMWCLGQAISMMADADMVLFLDGWRNARECMAEYTVASNYGFSEVENYQSKNTLMIKR